MFSLHQNLKKKKEVNQDGHTTTGQRFCFCDLVSDPLKDGFVVTSLSCYNCTSRICCLCCAVETEMGPLLLLFIMWQVVESLAIDWCCCCCVCCCWMLGQLVLLVLLLIAIATVCVDRFTSKHDWYRRCKWCTTSSRSSKSTPAKQKKKKKKKEKKN